MRQRLLLGILTLCSVTALAGNNGEQSVAGQPATADSLRTGPDVVARPNTQSTLRAAARVDDENLRLELRSGHLVCFSTSGAVHVTVKGEGSEETLATKHDDRGQLALRVDQLPRGQYVATAESDGRRCTVPFSR